jgi:hypothetical protein
VLSARGLCDGPIPRPNESHQLQCVTVYDLEALDCVGLNSVHIYIYCVSHFSAPTLTNNTLLNKAFK